jgi:hypothetical protein
MNLPYHVYLTNSKEEFLAAREIVRELIKDYEDDIFFQYHKIGGDFPIGIYVVHTPHGWHSGSLYLFHPSSPREIITGNLKTYIQLLLL